MKRFITLLFVFLIWLGGGYFFLQQSDEKLTIETTQKTIITKLENMQELATAKVHIQKIIRGKKELADTIPWWKIDDTVSSFFFKDEMVMTIDAEITAWFDVASITSGSITVHADKTVTLQLPPAKILSTNLTTNTRAEARKTGVLTKWDVQMETKLRNEASKQVTQEAIESGILQTAEENALKTLADLFATVWIHVTYVAIEKNVQ